MEIDIMLSNRVCFLVTERHSMLQIIVLWFLGNCFWNIRPCKSQLNNTFKNKKIVPGIRTVNLYTFPSATLTFQPVQLGNVIFCISDGISIVAFFLASKTSALSRCKEIWQRNNTRRIKRTYQRTSRKTRRRRKRNVIRDEETAFMVDLSKLM